MLRELIDAWRSDKCEDLCQAIDQFTEMLGNVDFVFTKSWELFAADKPLADSKQEIIDRDVLINKAERSIRRHLMEHLSINPRHDAAGCLALMSLVKDAERMGDYAKNIMDMAGQLKGDQTQFRYFGKLDSIRLKIGASLPKLKKAFADSDGDLAAEIIAVYAPIKKECKGLMRLVLEEEMPSREAAATALVTKFLGRIGSHLGNIASGITYPLDRIDFVGSDFEE